MRDRFERLMNAARTVARMRNSQNAHMVGMARVSCCVDRKAKNLVTYGDDRVHIVAEADGPALSIYLVEEKNPAVNIYSNGEVIRTHGQMWRVEDHILGLANPLRALAEQADD